MGGAVGAVALGCFHKHGLEQVVELLVSLGRSF